MSKCATWKVKNKTKKLDQNWCDNLPQKLSWAQSSGEPSLEWDRNAHTLNVVVTHNCPSHNHMSHTSDVLFLFSYKHHPYYALNITYCNVFFLFSFQYWSKDWEAWIIPESNTTLRLEVIPYTYVTIEISLHIWGLSLTSNKIATLWNLIV